MVHRMMKAELFGRPERFDQMTTNLGWICEHSSGMEREADDAQRESEELKLAEYLQRFVGQSFSAIVSGVSQGGLFAHLATTILVSMRRAIRLRARRRARATGLGSA